MVEKADAGGDLGLAGAVEVEAELDVGFAGWAKTLLRAGSCPPSGWCGRDGGMIKTCFLKSWIFGP
jgi:hypothetical protein